MTTENKKYTVTITYDTTLDIFYAQLPDFGDTKLHAPTPEKALSRAYIVTQELTEAYTAENIPLPTIGEASAN